MVIPNPSKLALRKEIKTIIKSMSPANRAEQSAIITKKVRKRTKSHPFTL